MIRSAFLPLFIVAMMLVAPAAPALAAPAKTGDDIEIYTAWSASLEDLAAHLVDLGDDNFVPVSAPYKATEKKSGRTVWAIDGIYVSGEYIANMSHAIKDQNGNIESVVVFGKTAAQFFASLTKAIDAGYLPMFVWRQDVEGEGMIWATIAVKLKNKA